MFIRVDPMLYVRCADVKEIQGDFRTLSLTLTLYDGRTFSKPLNVNAFDTHYAKAEASAKAREHVPWTQEDYFAYLVSGIVRAVEENSRDTDENSLRSFGFYLSFFKL